MKPINMAEADRLETTNTVDLIKYVRNWNISTSFVKRSMDGSASITNGKRERPN